MATKAEQRAYARKLKEVERRFGKLERGTLKQSVTLLRDFRNRVAGQMSELSDFQQWRISELQGNLDEMITQYEGQLKSLSSGAIRDSANLGRLSVVEPLETIGMSNVFFRPSTAQVNVLVDFSADLVSGVGNDMRKGINTQVQIAALGEKSPFHAMKGITKVLFGDERIPKPSDPAKGIAYEAERILRTETNRAYSVATHSQQKDLAEQVPGLEKQWIATGDSRTRASHLAAHGQVVPVKEKFKIAKKDGSYEKLMYPLDPAGSAENTISCRCRSITVIPEIGPIATPLDDKIAAEKAKRDKVEKAKRDAKKAAAAPKKAVKKPVAKPSVKPKPPVKKPSKPKKKPGKPEKLQPAGIPVTDKLGVIGDDARREFGDETLRAIDEVHGDGDLTRLRAYQGGAPDAINGQYVRKRDMNIESDTFLEIKADRININPKGTHRHMTFAHEAGHFIDDIGIPGKGFSSVNSELMDDWRDTVHQTDAYKKMQGALSGEIDMSKTFRKSGMEYTVGPEDNFLEYSLDDKEVFARSYSQYIAERSSSIAMKSELSDALATQVAPLQWTSNDFAPVGNAFDRLFEGLGWLK